MWLTITREHLIVINYWGHLYSVLSMSGRLRKQVYYFNSFYGLRLVDFEPFWFLFLIHKVGVPLLLLYIKLKLLTVSEGN